MKNYASKSMEGEYDLTIYKNKIILIDNFDGTTVETKCHPEDNFNLSKGIEEAFKKMFIEKNN